MNTQKNFHDGYTLGNIDGYAVGRYYGYVDGTVGSVPNYDDAIAEAGVGGSNYVGERFSAEDLSNYVGEFVWGYGSGYADGIRDGYMDGYAEGVKFVYGGNADERRNDFVTYGDEGIMFDDGWLGDDGYAVNGGDDDDGHGDDDGISVADDYDIGYAVGLEDGKRHDYDDEVVVGSSDEFANGYNDGYAVGDEGYSDGYFDGYRDGIDGRAVNTSYGLFAKYSDGYIDGYAVGRHDGGYDDDDGHGDGDEDGHGDDDGYDGDGHDDDDGYGDGYDDDDDGHDGDDAAEAVGFSYIIGHFNDDDDDGHGDDGDGDDDGHGDGDEDTFNKLSILKEKFVKAKILISQVEARKVTQKEAADSKNWDWFNLQTKIIQDIKNEVYDLVSSYIIKDELNDLLIAKYYELYNKLGK